MDAGAIADAAHIQIHHLAGETVPDTVDAVARCDKAPLLPLKVGIVHQLDLCAVVNVIISNLNNLAVGGADGVELTLGKYSLCDLLSGCHNAIPSCLS